MITITSLSKAYNNVPALRQVSLQVSKGETVVLLGHSGSGKSTLLRSLVGLTPFDEGTINVDGTSLEANMDKGARRQAVSKIRAKCGIIFQQYNLFPHLSILHNLTLAPRQVQGISKADAEGDAHKLLQQVGLSHKAYNRPHQLSGGEQQRVAVARALAMQPAYLLYDEPTSALDSVTARDLWKLMAGLAAAGQTQVVVTHQEQIKDYLPCRLIRMADGQIIPGSQPHLQPLL